jgi:hypothetical protein
MIYEYTWGVYRGEKILNIYRYRRYKMRFKTYYMLIRKLNNPSESDTIVCIIWVCLRKRDYYEIESSKQAFMEGKLQTTYSIFLSDVHHELILTRFQSNFWNSCETYFASFSFERIRRWGVLSSRSLQTRLKFVKFY